MTPLDAALAALDAQPCPDERAERNRAMARGLMRGYAEHWRDQERVEEGTCEVVSVEEEFTVPLYNLDTGRKSRTFVTAGRKDIVLARFGKRYVTDHKTTSEDIGEEGDYFRQLQVEGQASLYMLAEHLAGNECYGAIWDVIRRPGIRPRKLTKAEQAAVASLGTWCGVRVTEATQQHVIKEGAENMELYEIRVARECTEDPSRYFQRKPIVKLQAEMVEYTRELWAIAQEIIDARQHDRWPRSSGACLEYGACEYLGICSGTVSVDSDRFVRKACVHNELHTLGGDGRDVLTNTRIKCWQSCHRKHFYRYELGITRADREESEAIAFGNLMHTALEAYWKALQPQEETNAPDSSPAPCASAQAELNFDSGETPF